MGLIDRIAAIFRQQAAAPAVTTADDTPRRVEPYDLAGTLQADTERRATVKTCREMYRKDTRAKGVIKTLARDMTRGGFTVTCQGNTAAEGLIAELVQRLDLEHTLDDWVRLALRDGDTFVELGVNQANEIALVTPKPTLQMHRNSDDKDRFPDPPRAYWLAPEHWFGGEPPSDAVWFADWQIIHARWDHDAAERYGQPLFASATSAYKRIKEGETDIAVRRKTRSGIKYNHKFPEGTTPDQIEQYKELNQDNLSDPTAAIADFFGTAEIGVVAGEGGALEAIGDVMHHVRTWWLASPVPMSLLGYGQDLNRDVLDAQKEQYDRALESLTQWVEAQFVRPLIERQWLLKGILPKSLKYEIKWKTTETLKVATVVAAADAVKKLTDAGLPKIAAWEMVERFLPGIDLTQAKKEMLANAEAVKAQFVGTSAQPPTNADKPTSDVNKTQLDANKTANEPPITPQESVILGEVVQEYQRAADMLAQLLEFNPNHDRTNGQFASGGGGGAGVHIPAMKPGANATPAPTAGSDVRLTQHAMQRMQERGKYASVHTTMSKLLSTSTPPGDWFVPMAHQGKLAGYLVGTDGVVKTVLGPWYNKAKLRGEEIALTEAVNRSLPSITRSIQWQLDNLTPAIVATFCELTEQEPMPADELRRGWADWTQDGLEGLLMARSEAEDPGEASDD